MAHRTARRAQRRRLPLASLRTLASYSVTTAVTDPLLARCVAQGKGLGFVRGVIADVVSGRLPPPIPAAFSRCVAAGATRLTPGQLAAALDQSATGSQADSRRIGQRVASACIQKPAIYAQWRKMWVGMLRHILDGHHLRQAYVNCVLGRAGQIRPLELVKLGQSGSAAETAYGHKLGHECQAAAGG